MARKRVVEAERAPGPAPVVPCDHKPGNAAFRCEEREIEGARVFLTVGTQHVAWGEHDTYGDPRARGAFVRVEPPADATDEKVAEVRRRCEQIGAVRVQVLPRRNAADVLVPREKKPHPRARDVVMELVAEANAPDRAALASFVEDIMSRRSL